MAVGRGEEKEKYGRRREMGKDLRRWARASPLINHTRLYYFPFKLPPFRWPGGRWRRGGIRAWESWSRIGCSAQSIAAATFNGRQPPSSRSRYKHVSRELEPRNGLPPTLPPPSFIHHFASYHLDTFLRLAFIYDLFVQGTLALKSPFFHRLRWNNLKTDNERDSRI